MSPRLTRRVVVRGAAVALGAAALPACGSEFLAAEGPPAFDAAGYVADLEAIGCRLAALGRSRGGWSYMVGSPRGRGFGRPHLEVMQRWRDAIEACPDYGERVAAYLRARAGAGA